MFYIIITTLTYQIKDNKINNDSIKFQTEVHIKYSTPMQKMYLLHME